MITDEHDGDDLDQVVDATEITNIDDDKDEDYCCISEQWRDAAPDPSCGDVSQAISQTPVSAIAFYYIHVMNKYPVPSYGML